MIRRFGKRRWRSCAAWIAVGVMMAAVQDASSAGSRLLSEQPVVVTIRPDNEICGRIVRVADVATVDGGPEKVRSQIARLDLDTISEPGATIQVSSQQIAFRLLLAGVSRERFDLRGSTAVVTRRSVDDASADATTTGRICSNQQNETKDVQSKTDGTPNRPSRTQSGSNDVPDDSARSHSGEENPIVVAAKQAVLDQLPWDRKDIAIQLAHPISDAAAKLVANTNAALQADVRSNSPPLGVVQVVVRVSQPEGSSTVVPVVLDVRHFDTVVVSKHTIASKQKLKEEDVSIQRRDVNHLVGYASSADQVIGLSATRTIGPGQVVRGRDVAKPVAQAHAVVIKRGDKVTLVARAGGILLVSVVGEALQEGRAGDMINVRNVDSKKIIVGRIVSRDKVEVSL